MLLILQKIVDFYFYLNDEISDPRVADWLFMSNPLYVQTIVILYLYFIFKWGPLWMKNREPFQLHRILIGYNILQIVLCLYLVNEGYQQVYSQGYNYFCEPVDYSLNPRSVAIARGFHTYFLIKVVDLLDTVFFVLRKKNSQITFLHVYHHTGMVFLSWGATKYLPGGHGTLTGFINSFVHVIMYSYYLLTSFNSDLKRSVWWKKYITQMQILQFFCTTLHWSILVVQPNCKYPKFTIGLMLPQNIFMLALFIDFYRNAYLKKPVRKVPNDIQIIKVCEKYSHNDTADENHENSNIEVSNGFKRQKVENGG